MKKFLKKQWPLVCLALLVSLVAFYLIRAVKEAPNEPLIKEIMSGEGLKLKDIHYTQDDPEKSLKWVLDAKEVSFSEDRSDIAFQEFQLSLLPDENASFKLKGERGDYSRNTGMIELWGNLEGFSDDGYLMETEYMLVNEKTGQMSSDKPVKISGPYFSVVGKGFFVDMENEKIKILSNVTTTVKKELLI